MSKVKRSSSTVRIKRVSHRLQLSENQSSDVSSKGRRERRIIHVRIHSPSSNVSLNKSSITDTRSIQSKPDFVQSPTSWSNKVVSTNSSKIDSSYSNSGTDNIKNLDTAPKNDAQEFSIGTTKCKKRRRRKFCCCPYAPICLCLSLLGIGLLLAAIAAITAAILISSNSKTTVSPSPTTAMTTTTATITTETSTTATTTSTTTYTTSSTTVTTITTITTSTTTATTITSTITTTATTLTTSTTSETTTTITTSTSTSASTSKTTTTTTLHTGWNTTAATIAGTTGTTGTTPTLFKSPYDIVLDTSRALYIVDRDNNRVQKWLNGASSGTTVAGSASGTSGTTVNYLNVPRAIALDLNNNAYIADATNHRVVLWNVSSSFCTVIAGTGSAGSANNQLNAPYGVAYDSSTDIVYIADSFNDRIMIYPPGATSGTIGIGGTGLGTTQLNLPTGIFFDLSSNSLYITNSNANNIVRWPVGATNWILVAGSGSGTSGSTATLLSYPRDVTLDYMKNVYVSDTNNNRIQYFPFGQTTGLTIAGTGTSGSGVTQLNSPIALAVDTDFNVYVADLGNNRIQRFDHY